MVRVWTERGVARCSTRVKLSCVESLCVEGEAEALDGAGAEASGGVARGVVGGFDEDRVHLDVAFGDFKAGGQAVEKFFDDALVDPCR